MLSFLMEKGIYYLEIKGEKYPYREIYFENKWNIIATTELSKKLFDNEVGDWTSEEARIIDEKILFFIDPDQITLTTTELIKIISLNVQ